MTIEVWIRVCMHSNEMIQVSLTSSYGHWTISLSFKNLVSPELLVFVLFIPLSDVYGVLQFSNTKRGPYVRGKGSQFGRRPLGGRRWSQTACPRIPYPCCTLCPWGSTAAGETSPLTSGKNRPQERKRKLVSALRKIGSWFLDLVAKILANLLTAIITG